MERSHSYASTKSSELEQINPFNYINVENELSGLLTRQCKKTIDTNFFYYRELIERRSKSDSVKANIDENSVINGKKFSIDPQDLTFESVNHLEYILTDLYDFNSILGEGSFGIVVHAVARVDNIINYQFPASEVALKIIPIHDSSIEESVKNEVKVLMSVNSPRLVKVFSIFENDNFIVLEMELLKGPSLKDEILKRYIQEQSFLFTELEVSNIIAGILEGISILHENSIIHRDIKPENIMFKTKDDMRSVVIIDLGLFALIEDSFDYHNDKCGTLYYMAPEALCSTPQYNYTIDTWAIGIIMHLLISGGEHPLVKPYYQVPEADLLKNLTCKSGWHISSHIPKLAKNLFVRLCNKNKYKRIDTWLALKHPWVHRKVSQGAIPASYLERSAFKERLNEFRNVSLFSNIKDDFNYSVFGYPKKNGIKR